MKKDYKEEFYFKITLVAHPTDYDNMGCDGIYVESIEKTSAYQRKDSAKEKMCRRRPARMKRDYTRIKYYMDDMGRIWHGSFCPYDNMHYKPIDEVAVSHSNLPKYCVEISPLQAAQELARRGELC